MASPTCPDGDGYQASLPIAVVGLACRFPGDATSPERFWDFICDARTALSEIPKTRFNVDAFYHPSSSRQGTINVRGGYFLKQDIGAFDAPFFSMTAEEAVSTDPQQRLLLEVAYESIENAGIPIAEIAGSETSCFVGSFMKDYQHICAHDSDDLPAYGSTGHSSALLANRISWFFDLRGSSVTIDTGCSGSTVAFHMACESLRTGEAKIALAGGVGAILSPDPMFSMVAFNFLSPDSKCHSFDHRANGYARGEGFSILVLKSLADAIRDNDNIRAVVRSTAVGQDGRTPGITLPNTDAQASLIRTAYRKAGLGLGQTRFFEAHGTGTVAGDAAELRAIAETFGPHKAPDEPLFVGSVKTNIGHLEGCAGLAGILKAILCVENGMIPQNLWFEKPHPDNDLDAFRIRIPTKLTPWPSPGLRRASINCFGFGGQSCHIILDDAGSFLADHDIPDANLASSRQHSSLANSRSTTDFEEIDLLGRPIHSEDNTPRLLIWSSPESNGVKRTLDAHVDYLDSKAQSKSVSKNSLDTLRDLSYTLCRRRSIFPWRAFMVARSIQDLRQRLKVDTPKAYRSLDAPKLAFAFSGQGAQWYAMGRGLYTYEVFRQGLQHADAYLSSIGSAWSVLEELLARDEGNTKVNHSQYAQPLCTILQVALVDQLAQWGIKPDSVVGHSSGEIAAAYAAGMLTREDAWKIAYHRGRLCATIGTGGIDTQGTMTAVSLTVEEAEMQVAKLGKGKAVVACINGPRQVTVSGDLTAIQELEATLGFEAVPFKRLQIDQAYHSPHMKCIGRDYLTALDGIKPRKSDSPAPRIFSTVYGTEAPNRAELGSASYWVRNLTSPVKFYPAFQSLLRPSACRPDIVLEIGPHSVLRNYISQASTLMQKTAPFYSATLERRRDAKVTILEMAGALWSKGVPVNLKEIAEIEAESPRLLKDLPAYPWNHSKSYWHEARASKAYRFRKYPRHDLVGAPTPESSNLDFRWRNIIRVKELPWVQDHRVQGTILYPGAGMITMVLEAAQQLADPARGVVGFEIHDMNISTAMVIPTSTHGLETILCIIPSFDQPEDVKAMKFSLKISSRTREEAWQENCTGRLCILYSDEIQALADWPYHREKYTRALESHAEAITPAHIYEKFDNAGLQYGRLFRNVTEIKSDGNITCSSIRIPDTASIMPENYEHSHLLHPACLDAMFQTVVMSASDAMVPTSVGYLFISANLPRGAGSEFHGYSEARKCGLRITKGNIIMTDSKHSGSKVVLQDVGFTSLVASQAEDKESASFTEKRSKICSECIWKQDVELLTPIQMQECLSSESTSTARILDWFDLVGHSNPEVSILEIGNGSTELARMIVAKLRGSEGVTPSFSRYTWTSTNSHRIDRATEALACWKHYMSFNKLILEDDLQEQGFREENYDVILLDRRNFLDADTSEGSIRKLRKLLRPYGKFVMLAEEAATSTLKASLRPAEEVIPEKKVRSGTATIGRKPTNPTDNDASDHTAAKRRALETGLEDSLEWNSILRRNGFSGIHVHLRDTLGFSSDASMSSSASIPSDTSTSSDGMITSGNTVSSYISTPFSAMISVAEAAWSIKKEVLIIEPEGRPASCKNLSNELLNQLRASGIKAHTATLSSAATNAPGRLCISLLEMEEPVLYSVAERTFALFQRLVLHSDGLLWITNGAQMETCRPESAPVLGIFRSARSEDSGLSLHILDFSTKSEYSAAMTAATTIRVFTAIFGAKVKVEEYEFAERDGMIYIPRIVEQKVMNRTLMQKCGTAVPVLEPFGKGALELAVGQAGNLESLHFVPVSSSEELLSSDEVEVQVKANDVSFQDALTVMGQSSSETLGFGLAGVICRVGSDVQDIQMEDRVMGLCRGAYKSTVRIRQQLVQRIPASMSFEIAASLPSDIATANHALNVAARCRQGESVLIHDAATGFGLAAIQLAKQCGAEVFVTASNEAESALLETAYGMPKERVFDSRPAYFVAAVRQATRGRGVDIMMSALVGDTLRLAMSCISDFGRFIQVNKAKQTRPHTTAIDCVSQNITFTVADLESVYTRNLAACATILHNGLALLRAGNLVPPPTSIFPYSQMTAAFLQAQDSKGSGKVILTAGEGDLVPVLPQDQHPLQLDPTACYLIVGGFGGIGQSIAHYLVNHSARHIAILSRSSTTTEERQRLLEKLNTSGAHVRAYCGDVSDKASLEMALTQMAEEMPPIRGVINSAMALKDVLFEGMSHADYLTATAPKIRGSWNLHELLPRDLDFFIMLSSVAGIAGTRGQAAYNSGNAFQVALCSHRRAMGLKAVALDLTITVGIGFVADKDDLMQTLKKLGVLTISEEELLALVSCAITGYSSGDSVVPPEVMVGISTGGMLQHNNIEEPMWQHDNRFAYIRNIDVIRDEAASTSSLPSLRTALPAVTSLPEARDLIVEALVAKLAKSLMMPIEDLDTSRPVNAYGVDSLVAVDVRNWIYREMRASVSIFDLLSNVPISALAENIAGASALVPSEVL